MSLTVLNVSYPLARVAEDTAGGAEQILATLDAALVRAGHRSLVLAPHGSSCQGMLVSFSVSEQVLDDSAQRAVRARYRQAVNAVLDQHAIDVVHMHGIDFLDYLPLPGVPVIVTLHLPPGWYPPQAFQITRPDTHLVCVSQSQRRDCPADARIDAVIENGIVVENFRPAAIKKEYVVALGRVCPEKGLHLALEAASLSGLPLYIAGTVYEYPAHREYFDKEIRPRLVNGHRFLGPVGGAEKNRLLGEARCVLVSSLAPETSSLVAMEAAACGTPVVAFRAGALPETVRDGQTGFLVNSVEEMANAISRAAQLDPAECRSEAERRFSAVRMCAEYYAMYEKTARCTQEITAEVRG
ncbi:MAG TPA: glycosyltransferase family 4 protein [Terriglobales bacterium]|nr:glycosyltransferase family 4 protein [Terriglobales bacterium]